MKWESFLNIQDSYQGNFLLTWYLRKCLERISSYDATQHLQSLSSVLGNWWACVTLWRPWSLPALPGSSPQTDFPASPSITAHRMPLCLGATFSLFWEAPTSFYVKSPLSASQGKWACLVSPQISYTWLSHHSQEEHCHHPCLPCLGSWFPHRYVCQEPACSTVDFKSYAMCVQCINVLLA